MKITGAEKRGIYLLSQQDILNEMSKCLDLWKKKYGVKRIGLFGSYSRGEQRESSDIDVLVEFMDNAVTFDHYMELKLSLEDHFQKPVDLVIVDDIKPGLKPTILRSVKYAEGS
ncbi:Nucleotidyltransferase domain protein [Geobacillus sp. BCO2]|nr:Nucleotidyltransferase domain protein [Geobacillus sp. BCO2]